MPFWTRKTWVGTETDELTSMAGAQLSSLGADLANSRIALRLYDPPQLWRGTADRVLGPTLARQRILLALVIRRAAQLCGPTLEALGRGTD